jgi:DNA helicase-2/ATP-dependent DNA helicase PcrA
LLAYEESLEDDGERISSVGVDGADEDEPPALDREDDALLLRVHQALRGPLTGRRSVLEYEHIFVDEAQDMSPVELSVVLDTASEQQSVTLAGDIAQKLHLDNGFTDWRHVLEQLKLDHIQIEPLKLSYRSTHEILDFATEVLGPLRNEVSGEATRYGAPVELFQFGGSGEAVGFLSEALRKLVSSEPLSSVAVIGRYPEQADLYYKGLRHGEVPNLRRVAEQDFPFRPGVDVTDVRQVKGLEFDYVVIVECNAATFPPDDETRHLLHIAATRAAHQLWVCSTGTPSLLLPEALVKASA